MTASEMNALEGKDMQFRMGDRDLPFTAEHFTPSFSLPNCYFHAVTTCDILPMKGVSVGMRYLVGRLRIQGRAPAPATPRQETERLSHVHGQGIANQRPILLLYVGPDTPIITVLSGWDAGGMNLIELGVARIGRVLEISGADDYVRNRLYAMGLYPGVAAEVLRTAPGGDPYQLRIGGTLISVRAAEAARVLVEPID